jgi:mannose-6-phosphate isomerase-like protein (cupin superfamily)
MVESISNSFPGDFMMAEPEKKRTTHTMEQSSKSPIELMKGYVRDEKRESQVMRIVSGTAWVSMDGEDIILNPGEELKLSHGKYKALVSPASDEPLVYEFEE